jgi:hypothetical protein
MIMAGSGCDSLAAISAYAAGMDRMLIMAIVVPGFVTDLGGSNPAQQALCRAGAAEARDIALARAGNRLR